MVSWVVVGISDCGMEERSRQTGMSRRSISKQVGSMETELAEQREGGREGQKLNLELWPAK